MVTVNLVIEPPSERIDKLVEDIGRRLYARLREGAVTPSIIRHEAEAVYREIDRERFELGLPKRPGILDQAKFEVRGNRLDVLIPQEALQPLYDGYVLACLRPLDMKEWFKAGMPTGARWSSSRTRPRRSCTIG